MILPDGNVFVTIVAIVDPRSLMAFTVMVYPLSSLRFVRMCILMEPSEMVSVRGAPCEAEHLLTVTVCDFKSINGPKHCPGDGKGCGSR